MIPPSTTITDRGRRIRRALMWAAVGVIGLNVAVVVVDALGAGGTVSGPAGSSYVTTADGSAAVAGTLERLGTETARLRTPVTEAALTADSTLVVVEVGDAAYGGPEITAIDEYVRSGGRLVVAGSAGLMETLLSDPPVWRTQGSDTARLRIGDGSIGSVALSGFGSLRPTSADTPLMVGDDGTVVGIVRPMGSGSVVWIADSGPFLNTFVGRSDTAAAVVGMLGPGRRVVFDEYRHGFTDDGGLWSIIPPGWKTALVLGAVTLVVTLAAYGRRFGPPQDERRRLAPSRAAYLEAVAAMMGRGGGTADAVAVIRREARRLLDRRAGPGGDLEATARRSGLDDDAIRAVTGDRSDEETLVSVDRALATLMEERR